MKLVIDLLSNTIAGGTTDPAFTTNENQVLVDAPADFEMEQAFEWSYDGETVTHDINVAIQRAVTAQISAIKEEAELRITALDWRLGRAREREALGELGVESSLDVLSLREQIRQQSNAAELVVAELDDIEKIRSFVW